MNGRPLLPILVPVLLVLAALVVGAQIAERHTLAQMEIDVLRQRLGVALRAADGTAQGARPDPAVLQRGVSEASAIAALVEQVKGAVERSGGAVIALQARTLERRTEGEIGLRTQFVGDVRALQQTLHAIESAVPLQIVDSVLVRARTVPGSTDTPRLDITLDVLAVRAAEGP